MHLGGCCGYFHATIRNLSIQELQNPSQAYWAPLLGLEAIDRKVIETELQEYGAWDDLSTVDLKTLHERLVWVACGDLFDTPEDELDEVES